MRVPEPRGRRPAVQVVHRLVSQHRHAHVQERQVHPLTAAGAFPLGQRRLDADHPVKPGEDVDPGHAHLLRLAPRLAGQVHDPAHPLDQEIIARLARPRPVLAEAGDRGIDQPRVRRRKALVVEAEALEPAHLEVLDHHVGGGDQLFQPGEVVRVAEVAGDRGLAAVGGVEIGRHPLGSPVGARPVEEGRAPAAGVVALGRLDLDDLGAQIGQRLAGPRAGQNARQFDNLQPGQGRSGHCASFSSRTFFNSA